MNISSLFGLPHHYVEILYKMVGNILNLHVSPVWMDFDGFGWIWGLPKMGYPNSWMVYERNPNKMDERGGVKHCNFNGTNHDSFSVKTKLVTEKWLKN